MIPRRSTIPCRSTTIALGLGLGIATIAMTAPAGAQSNPGFYPTRYLVCHEETGLPAPPAAPPASPMAGLIPVARKRAPALLDIAPLEVADVAMVEPLPARPPLAAEPPPEPVVLMEGQNDFQCIGFTRGRAGILRVLAAPAGARFAHHSDAFSWRLVNARAAGAIGLTEAIPALRRLVDQPLPATEDYRLFDVLDGRLHAMRALADLGDKASLPRFITALKSREDHSYSLIWQDSLESLARLDKAAAQTYAIDLLRRIVENARHPTDANAASDDSLVREVLPLLTSPSATDLALVQRLAADTEGHSSRWHDACDVLAARLRLGDAALQKALRSELSTDLRTNRATVCYSQVMPFAFPGDDPDEVDTLLFRHRYEAILHLLDRARGLVAKEGKLDARWKEAQKKILAWLQKRSGDPDVAGDRQDTRFDPEQRALHLAALAALGDAKGQADLDRLIDDPKETRVAPWIAAEQALRLELPGAADHAVKRLRLAIDHHTDRYDTDLDPQRGPLVINDHVRVIDGLAARGDARFTLGLLDAERWGREAAAVHLARTKPAAACDLVGAAAKTSNGPGLGGEPVADAFWTLSLLGDTCRATMWKLLQDGAQPATVRGMALELLAMMRDPRVSGLLEPAGNRDDLRAARQRAEIIFGAKE
jgi:hypothetical protein